MTEDNNEIKRDAHGRLLPGQRSLNPTGRRSSKKFNELLDKVFPDELLQTIVFNSMLGLPTKYRSHQDAQKLIKDKNFKSCFKKFIKYVNTDTRGGLTPQQVMELIQHIWDRKYGKTVQRQEVETNDKTINVNIGIDKTLEDEI